jgi:hypothetical protein
VPSPSWSCEGLPAGEIGWDGIGALGSGAVTASVGGPLGTASGSVITRVGASGSGSLGLPSASTGEAANGASSSVFATDACFLRPRGSGSVTWVSASRSITSSCGPPDR